MLAVVRTILVMLLSVIICIFGLIYCLLSPRNPCHVSILSRCFGYMSYLFGIRVEVRHPENVVLPKSCIYISNHQNNYDMVTAAYVVQPRTIMVGKKSLLWIPLFGQLYWLAGNVLINRKNGAYAYIILTEIVKSIKKRNISIWIFPEGTRSRGRGLLPFKTGAFYSAIVAEVPIVPICVSNTVNKIKLNRWSNGLVIIEILPPVQTANYSREQVRELTQYCREVMKNKLDDLNKEVIRQEMLER